MAGGMSQTIGVLVKGNNQLSASLGRAEGSLASFGNTAASTSRKVNSGLAINDINTAPVAKASTNLTSMGTTALIAGAAAAAGLGLAVHSATKFNTAMAEVSTLVDTSTTDMGALASTVLSLSKEYGQMPVDTAKAMYTTISAGFGDAKDATVMLEGAMKLARGGITDTNTAIDGLTSIMNSYGMSADQVTGVSDQMFVAMKAGKTTIGELSTSMGKVTPLASAAGVSLDQLLAATSALTLGGLKTTEAATSLRGMLAAVVKPTSEASKTAEKLGIDFSAAAVESMGLADWLAHVKDKTGGNQESMATLFGSVEALSGVLALTGNQAGSFADILGQMKNSAGATQEAFDKMNATVDAAFARAKANASVLMITIGNALLPVVSGLADAFAWVANKISSLAEAHPFLTKLVVVLVAVSAAVAIIGGVALIMGAKVMAAMAMVNLSTGGIILIVGALIAVITGLVMYFTSGTDEMIDSTSTFGRVLGGLKEAFYAVAEPIAYGMGFMVGMFAGGWDNIKAKFKEAWDGIKIVSKSGWATVKANYIEAWDGIKLLTKSGWETVKGNYAEAWDGIKVLSKGGWDSLQNSVVGGLTLWEETFAGGTGSITRLYREMWDDIKIISKNGWDYVQDSMVTGIEFIVETFKDPRKKFAEGGKGLIGALGQGMRATGTFTEDSFAWALGGIDDLMSHSDAKKGPLSNLTASGSALVTTFASGITSAAGVAVNTLSGVMSDLRNLLPFSDAKEGPLSELTKSGSTVLSTFASGIEKTADAPLRAVSGALSNISMEPPNLPAASSTRESGGGAKAGVVFEPGAFQITVNGADGLDDLEGQLTEIFSRAALRLGVANG